MSEAGISRRSDGIQKFEAGSRRDRHCEYFSEKRRTDSGVQRCSSSLNSVFPPFQHVPISHCK